MSDNDTSRHDEALGRKISVLAFGDTADEIELYALDQARAFFGKDLRLEVVRSYEVWGISTGSMLAKAGGKQHHAQITVREAATEGQS